MSRYAKPMSQVLSEMKMNDPKLNKIFDKLKKGDKIKLKTSSTMSKGSDFVEYIVKSKNVVNKGRVEKITLATVGNEKAVKKFLYRRDGKVTFAMGDMVASIDDIKEELEEGYESEVLKVLDDAGIDGYFRNGKLYVDRRDAKAAKSALEDADNIMKLPKMVKEEVEDLEERPIDPADLDLDATDADKKAADKNIIMQMRKAMDVRGNMPIEFADGKKEKVDAKILDMMTKAHMKIQKPRDKEKFVAMISKSKRDMLNVAKKLATLKMGEEVELDENYRKLAMMGIGTETKKAAKVGLKTDYYLPKNGDKSFGKITRVTSSGYEITDEKTKKVHKFKFYDPNNDPTSVRGTREGLDEKFQSRRPSSKEVKMAIGIANDPRYKGGNYSGALKAIEKIRDGLSKYPEVADALRKANENLEEKYELYHKTFSDAMQHAYDYAKKKLGITVDPKEIDNKVATGPRKPSEGKTNKYRLKGKGGNLQIQVYNKGGSKPFELNMYKEENDMTKSLKDTIVEMWTEASEGFASDAQRKAAFASGYKEKGKKKKDEGNAFGAALQAAKENGEDTFVVAGKTYKVKDEEKKLDKVNPDAVKKKFDDRKDKDIDNDGDVDSTDKYLHKRRKAISKAVNTEEVEFKRYHETKQGSLRDAVLQMWGEGLKKDEKKDLTKEKKDGTKNMTDTGKEVTPVETSVKMPKIKETKNKV